MVPSFDCAASVLLCAEDSAAIFDLEEESEEIAWVLAPPSAHADASVGPLWIDFRLQSDECIEALLGREEEHLPMEGYAQQLLLQPEGSDLVTIRSAAIDWIWKVLDHYKFGPLTAVLSVNYLDRFLSVYNLPVRIFLSFTQSCISCALDFLMLLRYMPSYGGTALQLQLGEAWMAQLLSVACLSLAAKVEETIVPHPLDLQVVEAKFVFDTRTIQRMERLVLNTLGWRMQAVTPCSFIDFYLHKFSGHDASSEPLLARSIDLILRTSKVAEFLDFRPSEIAASIALVALGKHENSVLESVATCCKHLKKERVLGCYEMIKNKIDMGSIILKPVGSSVFAVPHSPIGVLDAAACESQQSESTIAECPAIYYEGSSGSKRRRICI